MLGAALKRFNTVNMPRTTDKLIATMMSPEMFGKTHVNQPLTTAPTVGINDTPDTDTTSNDLLQRCFGRIGNNPGINLAPAFQNAKNDGFPTRTVPASAPDTFGSEIGFIQSCNAYKDACLSHSSAQRRCNFRYRLLTLLMPAPVGFAVSEAVRSKANRCRSRRNLGSVILLNFWYLFF